jgi:chromosome segregation ATPase
MQMPEASEATPETAEQGVGDLHRAAQTIGQNLSALLCAITSLARLAEEVSTLRADLAAVRAEAGSHSEMQQLFFTRLAAIETALQAQEENQPRLLEQLQQSVRVQQESQNEKLGSHAQQLQSAAEFFAQLQGLLAHVQEGQQALLKRLDSQAEALRALHHAAQEHAAQREELRGAVQKLEMIAGAQAEITPLPQDI